jgi:hypothetical protein
VRNRGEYEGQLDIGQQLVADLIGAAGVLLKKLDELAPI